MKILSVEQLQKLDQYTIENEPISSINLMERAAMACVDWILDHFDTANAYIVVCGPGNNGGDGLAISRMLAKTGRSVTVYADNLDQATTDYITNYHRLDEAGIVPVPLEGFEASATKRGDIVIDALFGYGLNRPLTDHWAHLADVLSSLFNIVVAIDMPSGVFAGQATTGTAVHADFTLTFQTPKLAFFAPENQDLIGEWVVLDIGLDRDALQRMSADLKLMESREIAALLPERKKFDHKGKFGHALLVMGSYGKMGAAILSARAALRSGIGLLTVHVPRMADSILQIAVPEAMVSSDQHDFNFSRVQSLESYTAIGLGCGLGQYEGIAKGISSIFSAASAPLVIDADGLNAMARYPELMDKLPPHSILTPHFKEFSRLFGASQNHFERLEKLKEAAKKLKVTIILKGAHTAIGTEDGRIVFNPTGNPGMATAGSGDVLAGIITGLLAQGLQAEHAALAGVYLHGLAGDLAVVKTGSSALLASDIIDYIGEAIKNIQGE
ncbi:MAG: bifunctional ADP-dependent NAD(P)H-hydrate dehydratase/NAD(P)H-hydrate epimerase [Bacteroidetes bacterium]|nr:MAG: bifunctional ADP-dependent NAD(P)H-hydrate dehydratase/NAD(P)H-hydrate epimerase [Bacteroidota bacterium]